MTEKIKEIDILNRCKDRIADEQIEIVDLPSETTVNQVLEYLFRNEDGDAALFCDLHQEDFIFDHAASRWYKWSEHFWREDIINQTMAGIDDVIDQYAEEAIRQAWAATNAEKQGKDEVCKKHLNLQGKLLGRMHALQTSNRKKNILFLATVSKGLGGNEWDRAKMALPCINGIVDLQLKEKNE